MSPVLLALNLSFLWKPPRGSPDASLSGTSGRPRSAFLAQRLRVTALQAPEASPALLRAEQPPCSSQGSDAAREALPRTPGRGQQSANRLQVLLPFRTEVISY